MFVCVCVRTLVVCTWANVFASGRCVLYVPLGKSSFSAIMPRKPEDRTMQVRLMVPNASRSVSPLVAYGPAIADIAGGFTATQAIGGWKDDGGFLVVEPVTVFDCSVSDFFVNGKSTLLAFRTLAKKIGRELNQKCVYHSFDGKVELIEP